MHHHGYDTTGLVVFRRRCYASAVDCRMNGCRSLKSFPQIALSQMSIQTLNRESCCSFAERAI